MKKVIIMMTILLASNANAMGWFKPHDRDWHKPPTQDRPVAPELDTSAGGIALGLIIVGLALARERKR